MSGRRASRGADASDAQRAAKRQKRVDGREQPRTWEESRALLEEYRDAHGGDCNVPARWKDDPRLGKWVHTQKLQWKKYEADPATSSMSAECVAALRQMGAIDSWQEVRRSVSRTWEASRALLETYRDAHGGDCNVPRTWKDDPQLGRWVHVQKVQLCKYEADPATSSMSAERVAALRQMGAIDSWRERSRTWEESCARLEVYRDAHGGDCNVPERWKDDPQLGRWVHRQRAQLRKYEVDPATSWLSAERVAALWLMGAIDSWRSRERRLRASERESLGQKSYVLFEL